MLFICYAKCSTCHRAEEWLKENGVEYTWRDVKGENPTEAELRRWQGMSGLPLKRFFNTSGMQYKALDLSAKLPDMPEAEQFALLAADGMLVKRPILVGDGFVLVGFKQEAWEAKLK